MGGELFCNLLCLRVLGVCWFGVEVKKSTTLWARRGFLVHCSMTWKQLTERDRREWKLSAIDPHDRDTWRSGVRSAMRAASQLPGRGPTVVDMAPVPAH